MLIRCSGRLFRLQRIYATDRRRFSLSTGAHTTIHLIASRSESRFSRVSQGYRQPWVVKLTALNDDDETAHGPRYICERDSRHAVPLFCIASCTAPFVHASVTANSATPLFDNGFIASKTHPRRVFPCQNQDHRYSRLVDRFITTREQISRFIGWLSHVLPSSWLASLHFMLVLTCFAYLRRKFV